MRTRPPSEPPPEAVSLAGVRRPVPLLMRVALLVSLVAATVLLSANLRWDHPIGSPAPRSEFVIGPIGPGEAVEQTFPVSHRGLSEIEFQVRPASSTDPATEIVLRLYLDGEVVREGITLLTKDSATGPIRWTFDPLLETPTGEFNLQVSVSPNAITSVLIPVALNDHLDGTLSTNSIATAGHIDLPLGFKRSLQRLQVPRALLDSPLRAVLLSGPIVLAGISLVATRRKSRRGNRFLAAATHLALILFGAVLTFHAFAGGSPPDQRPELWQLLYVLTVAPSLIWNHRIAARSLRVLRVALRLARASISFVWRKSLWIDILARFTPPIRSLLENGGELPIIARVRPRTVLRAAAVLLVGLAVIVAADRALWLFPPPVATDSIAILARTGPDRNDPTNSIARYLHSPPGAVHLMGSSHLANVNADHLGARLSDMLGCDIRANNTSSGAVHPLLYYLRLKNFVYSREAPPLIVISLD
jgi:hypothetical protein